MQVPAECTLPVVERPLRVAEFADLFAAALRERHRQSPTRLRLVLDARCELQARDLAARETACCSFFTFTFTRDGDALQVDIDVPPAYATVLDGLAAEPQLR